MKAICTRYLLATNTRPARITAYDLDRNRVTLSVHAPALNLDDEDRHYVVARELARKMNWGVPEKYALHGGAIKGGYAWVFVPRGT